MRSLECNERAVLSKKTMVDKELPFLFVQSLYLSTRNFSVPAGPQPKFWIVSHAHMGEEAQLVPFSARIYAITLVGRYEPICNTVIQSLNYAIIVAS